LEVCGGVEASAILSTGNTLQCRGIFGLGDISRMTGDLRAGSAQFLFRDLEADPG
jgi:hypothetical protein